MADKIKVNMYDVDHRYQGGWHQEQCEFDSREEMQAAADAFAAERNGKVFVYEVESPRDVIYTALPPAPPEEEEDAQGGAR